MKKIIAGLAGLAALTSLAVAQTPQPAPKPMSPPPGMSGMGGMSGMYGAPAAKPAEKTALIDINSASSAELETLPGVGKARAEAIVKGRPYKGKDELTKKNIVPEKVYADIKDRIIAKQK